MFQSISKMHMPIIYIEKPCSTLNHAFHCRTIVCQYVEEGFWNRGIFQHYFDIKAIMLFPPSQKCLATQDASNKICDARSPKTRVLFFSYIFTTRYFSEFHVKYFKNLLKNKFSMVCLMLNNNYLTHPHLV